jgi:hypothetical protein
MEQLKSYTLDVVDWIDYRPDPSILPILLAAVLALYLGFQVPAVLAIICLFTALALTLVFFAIGLMGILGFIMSKTVRAQLETSSLGDLFEMVPSHRVSA